MVQFYLHNEIYTGMSRGLQDLAGLGSQPLISASELQHPILPWYHNNIIHILHKDISFIKFNEVKY